MSIVSFVVDRVWGRDAFGIARSEGRPMGGYARAGRAMRSVACGDERVSVRGLLVGVPVSLTLWFCIARLAQNLF